MAQTRYYKGHAAKRFQDQVGAAQMAGYSKRLDAEAQKAEEQTAFDAAGTAYSLYQKGRQNISESKLAQETMIGDESFKLYSEKPIEGGPVSKFLQGQGPVQPMIKRETAGKMFQESGGKLPTGEEVFGKYKKEEWGELYESAYKDVETGGDFGKYDTFKDMWAEDPSKAKERLTSKVGESLGFEQGDTAFSTLKESKEFSEIAEQVGSDTLTSGAGTFGEASLGSRYFGSAGKTAGTVGAVAGLAQGGYQAFTAESDEAKASGAARAVGSALLLAPDPTGVTKAAGTVLTLGSSLYDMFG